MTGLLTHLLGHPGRKASKGVQIEEKKSRIRETKNLSTNADSRTNTITFFHQEIAGDGQAL